MPLHLRKRGGAWHYSRTVPDDVRGIVGARYWRFSLRTQSLREAEARRSEWDNKFQTLIDGVRRMSATHKIAAIRDRHQPTFKGLAPVGSVNDGIEVRRLPLSKRDIARRRGINPDAREARKAAEIETIASAEAQLAKLSDTERAFVHEAGSVENLLNSVQHYEEALDLLGDYRSVAETAREGIQREVTARWHAGRKGVLVKLGMTHLGDAELPESPENPRLTNALDAWLQTKHLRASTIAKYQLHVRRLAEFTDNTTIKSLTTDVIAKFVEAYGQLPNARSLKLDQRKLPMRELLALRSLDPSLPPMGAVNVRKMVEYLRPFLTAINRADLRNAAAKPPDTRPLSEQMEGYAPFLPEQLRRLLQAVEEKHGRDSDLTWWTYLLAYSGIRPEEGAQLSRANVVKIGDIWAFKIDDRDSRRVKNRQSIRTTPLHPALIKRGFVEFARPNGDTTGLVFKSFVYDDKDGRSNNPSRRLKAVLNRTNITGSGSAHRFRASFIDAIRNAELPYSIEIGLVGHSDQKNRVHGGYGHGANLKTLARAIAKVDPLAD